MKLKMINTVLITALMMIFLLPSNILAEEAPEASADIAVVSKYVWRGFELSDDSMVIQPSITVSHKGFSFNLWGNLDTDFYTTNDSDFNETDMTLSYATGLGPIGLDMGYIYYALEGADTEEIYLSMGIDTVLSPSLTVYRDFDEFQGWYINLGISHSIDISDGMTLDLGGSVGYMSVDDTTYSEFHDGLISVGLTIPMSKYITFSPGISYSFGLSKEADTAIMAGPSADSDLFYGGITVSMAF